MQLFSKRNELLLKNLEKHDFIKAPLRIRIYKELEYISNTNEFLEKCFMVEDEKSEKYYIQSDSIKKFSLRELGYDITKFYSFSEHSLISESGELNDEVLFDLIEIILIFSKEDTRSLVRERFQKHFFEEGDQYIVHDFLITKKDVSGIKPFASFIKEKVLKEKLEQYYAVESFEVKNYNLLARISADILQFLFSGEKKGETKLYTEKLVNKLAIKCVTKENAKEFSVILNRIILDAKSLNNEISNIRHTDRSTLLIDNPALFKLIAANNIYLAELVIFANPENYFFSQKAFDFKNDYIARYKIPVAGWIRKKPKVEDITVDNIPF